MPLNLRKIDDLPELGPPKTSLRRNLPPASPKSTSESTATKTTPRKSGNELDIFQINLFEFIVVNSKLLFDTSSSKSTSSNGSASKSLLDYQRYANSYGFSYILFLLSHYLKQVENPRLVGEIL